MPDNPTVGRDVYTLRLHFAERRLLEVAALQRGEQLAKFIRRSALEAARRELATEPVER